MANETDYENDSTSQEFFCSSGLGARWKMFISILSVPLAITAFLGNILIIAALQKVSSLHPPSKILLGSLACTDLGVGLISHPLLIGYVMFYENFKVFNYVATLYYTIGLVFSAISLLTLTAISVDRLLALLLGLRYRQVVTLKRAWVLVATIWLFSPSGEAVVLCSFRIAAGVACIVVVPCVAISTFCYTKIYLTLRHHQTQVQEHVHQGQPNGGGIPLNIARYKKTVSSALWVQLTLLFCYLPYVIAGGIYYVTRELTPALRNAGAVTLSLALSNSSLSPFLYCWKIREVKQAVKETIRQLWCL